MPDDDFNVTFYPEGGDLLQGALCKVAFKAMRSNGLPEMIEGTIFDQDGTKVNDIQAVHLGMGTFTLLPAKGKSYHVVCTNSKGQSKRFDLPPAREEGYSLAVNHHKDRFFVSVVKPAGYLRKDTLYLVAHTRGMVQYAGIWDQAKDFVSFRKDIFPSGVLQLLLLDGQLNAVSERLVFIDNHDRPQVTCRQDRENYAARSLVKSQVALTGNDHQPLAGSFSVAVTDDKEVVADSTVNILTQLLLTSDLKGHIEYPAYYFQEHAGASVALDMLILTQGWRRYDIANVVHGRLSWPAAPLEVGPVVSGTVKSLILNQSIENIGVTIMSMNGSFSDHTKTDQDGRFYFECSELPDSTLLVVNTASKAGWKRFEIFIDADAFPGRTIPAAAPAPVDRNTYLNYIDKAEQKYTNENGIRTVHLAEVTITADRNKSPIRKSDYYREADHVITEKELERYPASNIYDLLRKVPGVWVRGEIILVRMNKGTPMVMINDMILDDINDLKYMDIFDMAQIDILKSPGTLAIFGGRAANGVIVIHTKKGAVQRPAIKPFHIKTIMPLGYQPPVAFYAPKYDTPGKRKNPAPDLRTTIHWQPNVQTDSTGMASFEFYTADTESIYTVTIEGMTEDGKIIQHTGKVSRK